MRVKSEYKMRRLGLTALLMGAWLMAMAQGSKVSVVAKIDTIEIFIGEQVEVTVATTADAKEIVEYPMFTRGQMLTEGIEVIAQNDSATIDLDGGLRRYTRKYRITSFDDSLYYMPPFKVKVGDSIYGSKSLALKVLEFPVDTTDYTQFFGPKDAQDNPFRWSEWSLLYWLSFVIVVLLLVAYYLYLRLRDNKPIIKSFKIVKRLLPHQKAMKAIEQIKADKMVSAENPKEYYTKLTDTLRRYIDERYGFSAMEMTTSEIIERLMESQDEKALGELRTLFETADLVKFAKWSTLINENDMNLVNAIDFINRTKLETPPQEKPEAPQLTEEEQRSEKKRTVLTTIICCLVGLALVGLVYAAWTIYLLVE